MDIARGKQHVIAGLDPAIHDPLLYELRVIMDARVKPAHDHACGSYRSSFPASSFTSSNVTSAPCAKRLPFFLSWRWNCGAGKRTRSV